MKHAGPSQLATRLTGHCSGRARCCSQPAGCYGPTAAYVPPTDPLTEVTSPLQKCRPIAYMHAFLEKCQYFRNDDPYQWRTEGGGG